MNMARTLAVLLCLGTAGPALAAGPSTEDSNAVARCVDAARKADGFGRNCIGVGRGRAEDVGGLARRALQVVR